MRILLDENLPKRLKSELGGHEVWTIRDKRWSGKKNGELLGLAIQDRFDVFITADQNIEYQHNLANYAITVVFLVAIDNTIERLKPLMPSYWKGSNPQNLARRCISSSQSKFTISAQNKTFYARSSTKFSDGSIP